ILPIPRTARRIVRLPSLVGSSAQLLGGLEVGLLGAHLVSPPGLAAPAGVAVLETRNGLAVPAQRVDEEDRRSLQQRVERPGPGIGHRVAAVEAAGEEVAGVADLRAVVDLVAQPLAPWSAGL